MTRDLVYYYVPLTNTVGSAALMSQAMTMPGEFKSSVGTPAFLAPEVRLIHAEMALELGLFHTCSGYTR